MTTWFLVQLAFDSRPSMNEGLRHSQDDIGFRQFGNPPPTEGLLRSQYAPIVDVRRLRKSPKIGTFPLRQVIVEKKYGEERLESREQCMAAEHCAGSAVPAI